MIDWITDALSDFFEFINALVAPIIDGLLQAVLSNLSPDASETAISAAIIISPYINIANYWIPLDFAFGLFTSYVAICFSVITYRLIIKLIPVIG